MSSSSHWTRSATWGSGSDDKDRSPWGFDARRVAALLAVLVSAVAPGCYYGHLAEGQTKLLLARQGVDEVLADPDTPEALRERIELVGRARSFGAEVGLDVGDQYTSYVAWEGDRIVTTVVATRPGEVEPAGFRFPFVGTLPYKGFFELDRAEREAALLRADGHDVCLVPVSAYSTLGWLDDPLTGPMLRSARTPGQLVETVLHELVHATVFAPGQADFNEGLAQAFSEAAVLRFAARWPELLAGGSAEAETDAEPEASAEEAVARERARIADRHRLAGALLAFRDRVAALYAAEADSERRRLERSRLESEAREAIRALPFERVDPNRAAERSALGDACLAIRGTYTADAPLHASRLEALGGDLQAFLDAAREAARSDDARRAFFGAALAPDGSGGTSR